MIVPPIWILVGGVVLAGILALAGVASAGLAALRLKKHVVATLASPVLRDVALLPAYADRLNATVAQMPPLLERVRRTLQRLNAGIAELKMPQAMLALRMASTAVRLLVSGR